MLRIMIERQMRDSPNLLRTHPMHTDKLEMFAERKTLQALPPGVPKLFFSGSAPSADHKVQVLSTVPV